MPWCDECSKFWNPNSMPPDGSCPTCGRLIGEPIDTSVPWHFWVLVAATVVYLGWRAVQGLEWLVANGLGFLAVALGGATTILSVAGFIWWARGRNGDAEGQGVPE